MLNITTQAYVYTIALIISIVIDLIISTLLFGVSGFIWFLVFTIITIPFTILSIYNIDCLSTGSCEIWAWVVSVLSCIYLFITTLLMVASASLVRTAEDAEKLKGVHPIISVGSKS